MNESLPVDSNHAEFTSGLKAIGHFLMTGLIRSGDCVMPSGQFTEDCQGKLNGLHLLMFKWLSSTSEFERQIIKLEDSSLDI